MSFLKQRINPLLAAAIILSVIVFVWGWFSSGLVFNGHKYPLSPAPDEFGLKYETVEFNTTNGITLKGWYVPAEKHSNTTIILCHGWGTNKSDILPSTFALNMRAGYNLLYFDFRNHGESGGNRTSLSRFESEDVSAALAYLKKSKPAGSRHVGIYGLSMGASAAIAAAAMHPEIEAVAAESPFSSFNDIIKRFAKLYYRLPEYPFVPVTLGFVRARLGFNPNDYAPEKYIALISPRPLLLIQGEVDQRMPRQVGEKLYAAAGEPKELWVVKNADHAEAYFKMGRLYEIKLQRFFDKAFSK